MQKNYLLSTSFQWQVIESLLTCKRKPKWELRKIWEAICYVTRTGCQWRLVPPCYAPWQTIYWYFRKWTLEGVIETAHNTLCRALRKKKGKNESASVGIIDSASVRMSSISGHQRGVDGNKKIKGSKRHIIVDTMGLIICLSVHAANIHDSKGAKEVFEKLYEIRHDHERLQKIFADGAYEGELGQWLKEKLNLDMEIVKRKESDKWEVLPKRWIVERTFAWLMNFRRLVMDYERTTQSVESYIYIAMIMIMGKNFN
jgi:putative transposase